MELKKKVKKICDNSYISQCVMKAMVWEFTGLFIVNWTFIVIAFVYWDNLTSVLLSHLIWCDTTVLSLLLYMWVCYSRKSRICNWVNEFTWQYVCRCVSVGALALAGQVLCILSSFPWVFQSFQLENLCTCEFQYFGLYLFWN